MVARMDTDTNVNWIAADPGEIEPLGVRMGFSRPAGETLLDHYRAVTADVRRIFTSVMKRLGSG